jgi:hypothetical protein
MEVVLGYKEFDVNKVFFIEPLNNLIMKKGLHINMVYKYPKYTLNEILMETPIMEAPFGIRKYDESDKKNKNKFYLDLSFKGYENDENINIFYNKIKDLDQYVINNSKDLYELWKLDRNNIENMYINQVRYNYKEDKHPPTFKIKMSKNKNGYFNTEFYGNKNKNLQFIEDIIPPGSKIQVVIKCNGIWSIQNRFGITWKVKYIKIINSIDKQLESLSNEDEDFYLLCDFDEGEKYIDFDMEDYYIYME